MREESELPEAYRIGWVPFLGLEIHLNSRPLIPRVETEWWVEQLAETMSTGSGRAKRADPETFAKSPRVLRILDLCAGSGAIGCALLKYFPDARVSFGEIDAAHEATIRKNIAVNTLDAARAEVRIGDLFEPFKGEKFDLIAANPPYVPEGRTLPASVADFEPALALRAGANGLAIIERIAQGLPAHLAEGGAAWIECDSAHSEEARSRFAAAGFSARILPDQYGAPRIIVVS